MAVITDITPNLSTMSSGFRWQDVTGRMLSLASSDDGSTVFVGSLSSGLWVSGDGGRSWEQVAWEQPPAGQFGVPGALGGCSIPSVAVGPESARWFVDRNPRLVADLTADGSGDIVAFGDTGVWTAIADGQGGFAAPRVVLPAFGPEAGGWQVDRHPRFVADLTGDGARGIVGFGDAGVWTALGNGDGTFQAPLFAVADFGFDQGWRVDRHPRFVGDLTGEGVAGIVGFGDAGVWTALGNGDGSFQAPRFVVADLGFDQGWRVDRHPRFVADLTGDGRADLVGFGDAGVWTALGNGDGTFQPPQLVLGDFAQEAGGWQVDRHPRFVADLRGDGRASIVGFGDAGVWTAVGNGDGTFQPPRFVAGDLGYDQGWRVEAHPRFVVDVTGDGRADLVGFGDAGVWTALGNGDGTFQPPRFSLANFGTMLTVIALVRSDREFEDAGIWRSTDGGGTWSRVHEFGRSNGRPPAGQIVWAPGTADTVFAAGEGSLAISTDAGNTWRTARTGRGILTSPFPANHVAVAATPAGSLLPPAVYALASGRIEVSLDGGMSWARDKGMLPNPIGGAVGSANSQNECVLVVSPRSATEVFVTRDANAAPGLPQLWRGDFSTFAQTKASTWEELPIPSVGDQDSGNVWLAITRPGQGEVLFYGPQRYHGDNIGQSWAGPLDPQSANDWHMLDGGNRTHVDLHGLFVSPDFAASIENGDYSSSAGTLWMLSDGGVDRSDDGGRTFAPAGSISSLSTVNFAGAAVAGSGPLLSLNTGDNDGFSSRDGGQSWRGMHYGGGDNDTSWSDPLRPHSMLVFTPRWQSSLGLYETGPGGLPDISSTSNYRQVPGPPERPGSRLWNAVSSYAIAGHRPLVHALPSEDAAARTDALLIRFYGNFHRDDPWTDYADHLAVLMRARDLRSITKRTDWDTPGSWHVAKHPRLTADLTGDGAADIVGFGDAGVWTALGKGDGTFLTPRFALAGFAQEDGGWRVDRHPRLVADLTGDGNGDIVGFGDAGVWTALGNGDGTFQPPQFALADLGFDQGWRVDKHPRFVVDLTGDGRADLVGFGDAGVWTALGNGDGTFQPPRLVVSDLGFDQGWRVKKHARVVADLTGDGRADLVGFGDAGVWTALGNGDGTFQPPAFVLADFGVDQGWREDRHPRFVTELNGDGRADLVGFGDAGVWTALGNGDGTFQLSQSGIADFGYSAGGWRVKKHPRFVADLTGDGRADIVGFGDAGIWTAFGNGDGTFQPVQAALADFGVDQGWRVEDHPRMLADLTKDGRADIVGFGDAGVLVAVARDDGSFREQPLFVIPGFGLRPSGKAEQIGPFLPVPTAGAAQAAGGRQQTTYYVGGDKGRQLWKWTEGMWDWQQLVPGKDIAEAKRFFACPYDADLVYAIDTDTIKRSDDGGLTWNVDVELTRLASSDGRIPIERDEASDTSQVVLSDMQYDPTDIARRFAVGTAGVFMTTDGTTWQRLLDTAAMRGLPTNCWFDKYSDPSDPSLYVGFAGRGLVRISDLGLGGDVILTARAPESARAENTAGRGEQSAERGTFKVRTADGRRGVAEAAPDGRVLVTFPGEEPRVMNDDEVTPED